MRRGSVSRGHGQERKLLGQIVGLPCLPRCCSRAGVHGPLSGCFWGRQGWLLMPMKAALPAPPARLQWRRQLLDFFETPLGKLAFAFLLALSLYTGLLFRLLNWALLFLALAPLFLGPYLQVRGRAGMRANERAACSRGLQGARCLDCCARPG